MTVARESLSFEWEWEPAESIRTPELSATFARLNVSVGDEDVTLVEDRSSRSSRRSIYVALYPLAEWIAFNWWSLLYDSRPSKDLESGAAGPHSVRASGDGFIWPNITIVPEGRNTRVAWRSDKGESRTTPTRYLMTGEALVDAAEIEYELANLVEATIRRLREMDVQGSRLELEWNAIRSLDKEEADFCAAVAKLGLDPFGDGTKCEDQVLQAADRLGQTPALEDFLNSVTIGQFDESLTWVEESLRRVRAERLSAEAPEIILRQVIQKARIPSFDHPWQEGWRQATAARRALEIETEKPFQLDSYLRELSVPVRDRELLAVGQAGDDASPLVVIGRGRRTSAKRFTMARALWRHVGSPSEGPFLISNAYTEVQRIERAFAAELLAPAEGIASLLEVDPSEAQQEDLESIADCFDVSVVVVQHQLENQLLGRT